MSQQPSSIIISRKARLWPEIPHDIVKLPTPPPEPSPPSMVAIITLLLSVAGTAISGFIFSKIGGGSSLFFLAFIVMGMFAAIGSLLTFIIEVRSSSHQRKYLFAAYKEKLLEAEKQLRSLQQKEQQARIELDPPLMLPTTPSPYYDQLFVTSLVQRSFNEQDPSLWSRRPDDPDFLTVRIGMGNHPTTYQISGEQNNNKIALPTAFDTYNAYACALMKKYSSLAAPVTVKLNTHSPLVITSGAKGLSQARVLARCIVSQLVYHHTPEDVRIIILAPQAQAAEWQWATVLPHMQVYDPSQVSVDSNQMSNPHTVAIGPEAVVELLPLISRELGRRELLVGDERRTPEISILPRLVIVVDHFDPMNDLDPPPLPLPRMVFGQTGTPTNSRSRLTVSPLKRAEMTLALSRGAQLGVSVVCVCASKIDIPVTSDALIDLDIASYPNTFSQATIDLPDLAQATKKDRRFLLPLFRRAKTPTEPAKKPVLTRPQACIRLLHPDPPPLVVCDLLDAAPIEAFHHLAQKMQSLRSATTKRVQLRTQVDLRELFEPGIDLISYDPTKFWLDSTLRSTTSGRNGQSAKSTPLLRIPIGQKMGDELQHLDLIKDGPHGLLIGQTGSGKSELLQTIVTALAIMYRPAEVTFLLIDYKAGLALEPFRLLPHTIGFLSNVSSPALIQRFITMLRAEAVRREKRLKEGKATPRLVIIIDEFAEMAKRTEMVLDELFTITRVGREIGMHLLLSAQRPEGIIGTKVRDYVQYRLCLRCASDDDSREVLGRTDAAKLPVSIPGRCYLLHGDNQLDLFQAARATIAVPYS